MPNSNATEELTDCQTLISAIAGATTTLERNRVCEKFFENWHRFVFAIAKNSVGENAAEDITQDVFVKVHAAIHKGNGPRTTLIAWLATIIRNCCVDYFRQNKKANQTESLDALQESNPTLDSLEASDDLPSSIVEQRDELLYHCQVVRECLASPACAKALKGQKLQVVQAIAKGISIEDTCEMMKIPKGHYHSVRYQAIKVLRKLLEPSLQP